MSILFIAKRGEMIGSILATHFEIGLLIYNIPVSVQQDHVEFCSRSGLNVFGLAWI